jgi:predicted carbohydrate-binding protein with CBM5 and CBM33 domain
MSSKTSNARVVTTMSQRIAGLQKYGASLGPQVSINGQSFTIAQLTAVYQACVDDRTKIASARGALSVLVAKQETDDAAKASIDQGLKAAVVGKFGAKSQEVVDFGYVKQPKSPTVAVKAQAVEQSANTRKARHTMGKVQRKKIKADAAVETTATATPASASTAPAKG